MEDHNYHHKSLAQMNLHFFSALKCVYVNETIVSQQITKNKSNFNLLIAFVSSSMFRNKILSCFQRQNSLRDRDVSYFYALLKTCY